MNAISPALLADTSLSSPGPDAELIRLCAEADALTGRSDAIYERVGDKPTKDPRWAPLHAEANRLGNEAYEVRVRILGIRAQTLEGLRAKASYVLASLDANGLASEMALSIAEDLIATGAQP